MVQVEEKELISLFGKMPTVKAFVKTAPVYSCLKSEIAFNEAQKGFLTQNKLVALNDGKAYYVKVADLKPAKVTK